MSNVIEDKFHARISPSASKRWMTCPGSARLIEALNIPNKASKFAAEGTVAHEVHEKCLLNKQEANEYIGQTFESDGFKFKVNQEMADAVQESLDYIRERIAEAEDMDMRVEVLVEVWADLKYLGIEGLDGGTSDVVLLFWEGESLIEIEVVDYKHGAGVAVDVTNNTQALHYGLGVVMNPDFNGQGIPEGITITISQPRAHHPEGRIRSWNVSKEYVLNWEEEELIPKAKRCHDEDAPFVPSDDGCRFCDAAGQCPALFKRTQEVAMMDFDDVEAELPMIDTLTADQKRFIMDHAGALRSFIVAVENQIKLEVDSGSQDYSGHYKLVRKTTQRKLTEDALDPDFSPLLDYIEEDDMYTRKPKGIGELEKSIKEELKSQGVKGFVKKSKEIMEEVTTKPTGELVIAPESDKRMGVQPSIVGDFANLDD
jgi:CRISPR/Cas system-associated exonuclease Cas4 (RecB family)